ncbi:MAG TPA: hypothetical protein VLE27_01260, partial [Thermoanaerobaculia bacterium]|nr:hypothetical protein [Thermoanaerobaculia bacterium]
MDQELSSFLKESFSEMSRQLEASHRWETARLRKEMASFREEVSHRLKQQEETIQQTRELVEELFSTALLMSEGAIGLSQRIERYQRQSELSFQQVHKWMRPYFEELSRQNQD